LLLATHDHRAARFCDRRLLLDMGALGPVDDPSTTT